LALHLLLHIQTNEKWETGETGDIDQEEKNLLAW
jgi:hypothetical protein